MGRGPKFDFNNLLMVIQSSLTLQRKRLPDGPTTHRLLAHDARGCIGLIAVGKSLSRHQ